MAERWLVLAAALGLACGDPDPDDFDRSCEVDEDCAVVVSEGHCGECDFWDALEVSEAERFARLSHRSPPPLCTDGIIMPGCGTWDGAVARCVVGRCELGWTAP